MLNGRYPGLRFHVGYDEGPTAQKHPGFVYIQHFANVEAVSKFLRDELEVAKSITE